MSIPIYNPDDILAEFGGRERFARYVSLLLDENQRINLVSRETSESDLHKLIADCLFPLSSHCEFTVNADDVTRALDVGSGGGLPALPLGIALGDCEFTLIERTQKKARFLESALGELGISGSVISGDFSEVSRSERISESAYQLASLRWVKLDSQILRLFVRFLQPGGELLYYSPVPEELESDGGIWEITSQDYLLSGDERDCRTVTMFRRK